MLWVQVQKELDKKGWSLRQFAVKSGIPEDTLKGYKFRGTDPLFKNACKIADALDISLDELRERSN